MNKRITFIICIHCCSSISIAQKQTIKPDISAVGRFKTVNRDIAILASDPAKVIVHLNGKPGDGVAWINNITFEKGIIEFDVKGKNVLQQSFVGDCLSWAQ